MNEDSRYVEWMEQALEEAQKACVVDEVPVGAVVIHEGQIIGRGHNQPIGTTDPTAHAEIVAMRAAANHLEAYRLVDTTLVATLEPCFMCCGAMIHARVGTLVYGADDPKGGAVELLDSFPRFNHQIEVVGGIEAERCGEILREYFRGKRS